MLRGSSPQEGDPLGIYPGVGLDSRLDPALLPEARAQLVTRPCAGRPDARDRALKRRRRATIAQLQIWVADT